LRTPAEGTGIINAPIAAVTDGSAFNQCNETSKAYDNSSQILDCNNPQISQTQQELFQELVEAAGDFDLDQLCNDLLDEGFPDFNDFATETTSQDPACFEKNQIQENTQLNQTYEYPESQYTYSPTESYVAYDPADPTIEYTLVSSDDPILGEFNECQEYIYDYNDGYQYENEYCAL
jgi:hypothetical protein